MRQVQAESTVARAFAALGNETRLQIVRLLVKAGGDGLNVGELQKLTCVPPSTMAHHLAALSGAGLLRQEKHGREVVNTADFATLKQVSAYLLEDCCAGVIDPSQELT